MTINLPTLEQIETDPSVLDKLPIEALAAITDTAKEAKARADTAAKAVTALLERRYGDRIAELYRAEAKDTGSVHIFEGDFDLQIERSKKVEWDQAALAAAGDKIAASGDDPHEYLTVRFGVEERKFTSWPTHIRAVFEPARSVKPGPTTIKIVRVGEVGRRAA
jgi:hypothetical protein